MTWKQQQLVDYFKEYSLETPTIQQKDFRKYTKRELIQSITEPNQIKNEQEQKVDELIKERVIVGRHKAINYLDTHGEESSSDETDVFADD